MIEKSALDSLFQYAASFHLAKWVRVINLKDAPFIYVDIEFWNGHNTIIKMSEYDFEKNKNRLYEEIRKVMLTRG